MLWILPRVNKGIFIIYNVYLFTCNMGCNGIIFFFRHHTYKKVDGQVELTEVGPRFEMKGRLYTVRLSSPVSF